MKKNLFILSLFFILASPPFSHAQEAGFPNDLFINTVKVENYVVLGGQVRFYVEVGSSSAVDMKGVVQAYDEGLKRFVGAEQAVSVLAGKTDAVFFDYVLDQKTSTRTFNLRIIPDDPTGDNPANNTKKVEIYVDVDSDKDGKPNKTDTDDDNDGVNDDQDAFPLNSKENLDSDGDKIGNNEDTDDDNDGVEDLQDAFPLDPKESKDSDGDGVGDNSDAFVNDPKESEDTDGDGLGNNADTNDNNKGPIVEFSTPETVVSSRTAIPFQASKSSDPDGKVVSYDWDFGDGKKETGVSVEHEFKKSGDYQVTLKITDDQGESRSKSIKMTVVHKWQAYVLGGLAFLFFLFLLLYWLLSRKKNKENYDEADEKVSNLALKKVSESPSSPKKKKGKAEKPLPKKKK